MAEFLFFEWDVFFNGTISSVWNESIQNLTRDDEIL